MNWVANATISIAPVLSDSNTDSSYITWDNFAFCGLALFKSLTKGKQTQFVVQNQWSSPLTISLTN